MKITTSLGTYERRAWTGGDTPPEHMEINKKKEFDALTDFFYQEQIKEASFDGKLSEKEVLEFWECAGTSAAERKQIFFNRARFDAWRTLNN